MKIKMIPLLLMFCIGFCIMPEKASAQVSVSFQVFYDELSPYGVWVDNPQYGYVWIPNEGAGFSPYASNGYWTFTEQGWTWVSNYQWGWAPFHYGRWYNDAAYGPIWVPGYEWGPGWVSWRRSGTYYGWAPMGPGVTMGMAYGSGYYDTYNTYTFVPCGYMGRTTINNYYVNNSNNTTIINNTTVINNNRVDVHNVSYSAGPERREVEKQTGKTLTPVAIKESNKPGQNLNKERLEIYRPQVERNNSTATKPAPVRVSDLKEVKTPGQRTVQPSSQKANQPPKQQVTQPQRNTQPDKANTSQPQQSNPVRKTETGKQPQRVVPGQNFKREKIQPGNAQPNQQQPVQQKRNVQPTEQRRLQPQQNQAQPIQQSPPQQQPQRIMPSQNNGGERNAQPAQQQPPQQKPNVQPSSPQQPNIRPQQQPRTNPRVNTGGKHRPQ